MTTAPNHTSNDAPDQAPILLVTHADLAALRVLRDHYAAAIDAAVHRGQDGLVRDLAASYADEARAVLGPAA